MSLVGRKNVLAGMVHGKVDWISGKDGEIGMYLRPQDRETSEQPTRCVMRGPTVDRMLAERAIQKGMTITAHGEYGARAFRRNDNGAPTGELICYAHRIEAESTVDNRFRGVIYATMKGVIMNWDPTYDQVKTFINPGDGNRDDRFTISLSLRSWLAGMNPASRERFKAGVRKGREFTTTTLVDVSYYTSKDGVLVPALLLLPTDFRLQG